MRKYNIKKYILFGVLTLVLLISPLFGASYDVFAQDQIEIVFDWNQDYLKKYLDENKLSSFMDITKYYNDGDLVEFPTNTDIPNIVSDYYLYPTWMCDGEEVDTSSFVASKSCVLTARWSPKVHTVYYCYSTNKEKSEITNLQETDTFSIEREIVFYTPIRPNYVFGGWYLSDEYSEYDLKIYTHPNAPSDQVIYAKWTPREYSINYNTDATNLDNLPTYNVETPTFRLYAPSKEGHIFLGWYLDSEFTTPVTQIEKGHFGDLNLYPKWQLEEYDVTYVLPDGSTQVVTCEYGKKAQAPSVEKNIFQVLKYSRSTKNITGDCEITVEVVNIWYVYVAVIAIIVLITIIIIAVKKHNEKKLHKLKAKYKSNLNKKTRVVAIRQTSSSNKNKKGNKKK